MKRYKVYFKENSHPIIFHPFKAWYFPDKDEFVKFNANKDHLNYVKSMYQAYNEGAIRFYISPIEVVIETLQQPDNNLYFKVIKLLSKNMEDFNKVKTIIWDSIKDRKTKIFKIKESIEIPLEKGNHFKYGKFKNKDAIYDSNYINEKGDLIIITDTGKEIPACKIRVIQESKVIMNRPFKAWITPTNDIINFDYFETHFFYLKKKSNNALKEGYIRVVADTDLYFEVWKLDNIVFKRIHNFFIKNLKNDTREIFIQDASLNKIKQYKPQFKESQLEEDLRLSDLTKHAGVSDLTRIFMKDRQKIKGAGNISAKLVKMKVNKKKGWVTFVFLSEPTYTFDTQIVKLKTSDKSMRKDNLYTQEIRILDIFSLLKSNPEFKSFKDVTIEEIKKVLKNADVQVSCDDPSFWWQGDAWTLTQFDASIIPCEIEPKHWGKFHNYGDNFLCKHLSLIFNSIDFYIPIMAGMIYKYLNR
jgi:hypothetical protein